MYLQLLAADLPTKNSNVRLLLSLVLLCQLSVLFYRRYPEQDV